MRRSGFHLRQIQPAPPRLQPQEISDPFRKEALKKSNLIQNRSDVQSRSRVEDKIAREARGSNSTFQGSRPRTFLKLLTKFLDAVRMVSLAINSWTTTSRTLFPGKRVYPTKWFLISGPMNPEGIKPCCACPLTKQKRDDCFMNTTNAALECKDFVQAHKECKSSKRETDCRCMAGFGFKV
jgi:hypothetical protein